MNTTIIILMCTMAVTIESSMFLSEQEFYKMNWNGLHREPRYEGNESELSPTQSYFVYQSWNPYHRNEFVHHGKLNESNVHLVWMCKDSWDTVEGFVCIPTRAYMIIAMSIVAFILLGIFFYCCYSCCSMFMVCGACSSIFCCKYCCNCYYDCVDYLNDTYDLVAFNVHRG